MDTITKLTDGVLEGDRRSLARLITLIENGHPESSEALKKLYPHTGRAHVIGITGPPGSGKSTIINQLIKHWRGKGSRVGVLAYDPSSPFSGGAILGDRIRMLEPTLDRGVFIRSMATRGELGGITEATGDIIRTLDAFGMNVVIVETVGAGQGEVDVMNVAHTVVLVVVPGLGDEIQALKAGLMEIGDIFVVNKADKEDVDRKVFEIMGMMGRDADKLENIHIVKTVATKGEGIPDLIEAIEAHYRYLRDNDLIQKMEEERSQRDMMKIVVNKIRDRVIANIGESNLKRMVQEMAQKKIAPLEAADELLRAMDPGSLRKQNAQSKSQ